jgi:hypothetical protein
VSKKINSKPAELDRCDHSLRDRSVDPISGEEFFFNRPCILVFHTGEDEKGRPVHQDERGRVWS